jgi:hypothetical protein
MFNRSIWSIASGLPLTILIYVFRLRNKSRRVVIIPPTRGVRLGVIVMTSWTRLAAARTSQPLGTMQWSRTGTTRSLAARRVRAGQSRDVRRGSLHQGGRIPTQLGGTTATGPDSGVVAELPHAWRGARHAPLRLARVFESGTCHPTVGQRPLVEGGNNAVPDCATCPHRGVGGE